MTIFGSSQRVNPGNLGMRLFQSAGVVLPWWNPDGATPGGVGGSCVGAYQAISAASYAASKVNLANPGTNDLTEIGGAVNWAFGVGWSGFAALGRCLSSLVPTLNQTWSVLVQFSGAPHTDKAICGLWDTVVEAGQFSIEDLAIEARVVTGAYSVANNPPALPVAGNYGFAGLQPYRDGAAEAVMIPAAPGTTDLTIYIGARNNNGARGNTFDGNIESVAIYDVTLTAPQVAAREARMVIL